MRSPLLAPLSGLFGAAALARRFAYDRGWLATAPSPLLTVSVGGLEAGGSGKTPVAAAICAAYGAAGRRPGLLSRGYGRRARGLRERPPFSPADPAEIGDEPAMIALAQPGLRIVACADRRRGAARLVELGCDVLVLDDGFSHRALGRDVDIVVLRAEAPFGRGRFLPWGDLREPPSSLARASIVWLHFREREPRLPAWLAARCPRALPVASRALLRGPYALEDATASRLVSIAGARVLAVAGIARPRDLEASLRRAGADVVAVLPFADHHAYRAADVARIVARARALGADVVVATAKDAVKLRALAPAFPWLFVDAGVEVVAGRDGLVRRLGVEWPGKDPVQHESRATRVAVDR